jgi:hypothetical protein
MACRVCSVNSNQTGRPLFFWRTVAAIERVAVWCHIIDAYRHDVAAAQLAVDGEVKQCEIADTALKL